MTENKDTKLVPKQRSDIDVLSNDLVDKIVICQNKEELENLYTQFKINNTKKNAIRVTELNNLLDSVNKEAIRRFKNNPDTMTNREILDYMNGIQAQIDRSQKIVEGISDISATQVNNTQNNTVNINVQNNSDLNSLNRESRDRITSFIAEVLKQGAIKEAEVIENQDIEEKDCIIKEDQGEN